MMEQENSTRPAGDKKPFLKREEVQRALVYLRYLLPLFSAVLLLLLGLFYNVYSLQLGRRVQVSVLQLWFNTLKATRSYLLNGNAVTGTRNFYVFLAIGAVLVAFLFLLSLLFAALMLYVLRRVASAHARGDRKAEKEAKILLYAFLPNRIWAAVTNLLLLPFALFPELFSFICGRFLTVSGGNAIYIRLNVVALVIGILSLCTLVLAIYNKRAERALGLDLFFIDDDGEDETEIEEDVKA